MPIKKEKSENYVKKCLPQLGFEPGPLKSNHLCTAHAQEVWGKSDKA